MQKINILQMKTKSRSSLDSKSKYNELVNHNEPEQTTEPGALVRLDPESSMRQNESDAIPIMKEIFHWYGYMYFNDYAPLKRASRSILRM
jgi:hypothetical protein